MLLSAPIFEHAEACNLVAPGQKDGYYTFSQSPFPRLPKPQKALSLCSLSHKHPKPLAWGSGADLRCVLLSGESTISLLQTLALSVLAGSAFGKIDLV